MLKGKTVVVGMSGGVDSSVSALLLKQQGANVIALFMRNWEEKSGDCPATADQADVSKVCDLLEIPHYTINFTQDYWDEVFAHFLTELKQGLTPNPDILCNREIKFKRLFDKARQLGAEYLATGHYCQTHNGELLRGHDANKDQSYFLYTIQKETLDHVLFPVGHLNKSEVREIARAHNLPTAEKKDSTGICFIGERNFSQFLSQYIAYQPGNFETLGGKIIGKHRGVSYYTIGQRKGLEIGGPGAAWFVVGKDLARNVVFIEQGENHPALFKQTLTATNFSWVSNIPPSLPFACTAKIRYRQPDQSCTIEHIEDGVAHISFSSPQRAITPGQAIVFYDGNLCLGGATIQ